MDGQAKISSPTFPSNTPDGLLNSRPSHFTPILPDHGNPHDSLGNDGYDSNRSPSGSGTMGEHGSGKRKKVNHGTALFL
jgi:hypothetical protein